jgi:hypothetical protein
VIPRRLHDAFVIMVSFFRELFSVALDTAHCYQKGPMPTHCWLAQELEKYKREDEIMAEEITIIIMNGGILTLNPNEDWTAEGHEGIRLPTAITAGILTLLIPRAQAPRWLNNSEWGAEASVKVMPTIHVPEQSDVKRMKMWELGTHASHLCMKKWRNGRYTSVQMAERIASYAISGIDDKLFLNEPVIVMFQQSKASRTSQRLQIAQLTKQDLLLYAPGEMPKEPKDDYSNVHPAHEIIENPDVCHDKGAKSIVQIVENFRLGITGWKNGLRSLGPTESPAVESWKRPLASHSKPSVSVGTRSLWTSRYPATICHRNLITSVTIVTVQRQRQNASYGSRSEKLRSTSFDIGELTSPKRGGNINTDAMLTLVDGCDWTSYLSGSMERPSSALQTKSRQIGRRPPWGPLRVRLAEGKQTRLGLRH